MTDLTADQLRQLRDTIQEEADSAARFIADHRAQMARADRKKRRQRVKAARRANR